MEFFIIIFKISSDADGKYARVKEIHRHEKWDPITVDHDFAILTLEEPLQLDETIQVFILYFLLIFSLYLFPLFKSVRQIILFRTIIFQTISLPRRRDEEYSGKTCKASGWGDLEFCKEKPCNRPNVLQQVITQCISNEECSNTKSYKSFARKNSRRMITENMICAGNMLYGGEDACQGDSGGKISIH